jgi:hypothetical protein
MYSYSRGAVMSMATAQLLSSAASTGYAPVNHGRFEIGQA